MAGMICDNAWTVVAPAELTELVRGTDEALVNRLEPLVRMENVTLDLASVERIDAAGLAALIRLYCDACAAGNGFAVLHPGRHVREILGLVGLEKLLVAAEEAGTTIRQATAA